MINNQKITKRAVLGATSVLAAGALLGVGAAGASAATVNNAGATPQSSSSTTHDSLRIASLLGQLRADLFQGTIDGATVQQLAQRITGNSTVFSALPASLQSDLTSLKNASASDAVAQAQNIKATALAGDYGQRIETLAADLQSSATLPITGKLIGEIRADLAPTGTVGEKAARIANTVSEHPRLLSKLPASLRSDVTDLKNAPASDDAAEVEKIETTAITGGYGARIQKLAQQLESVLGSE
jgi:hypothetical protein